MDDIDQQYALDSVCAKNNIKNSKTPNSEIITISLCDKIAGLNL